MGALAAQQPDRISDAIRYQPDPNNPAKGVFNVTLHQPGKGAVQVEVSQTDVQYNIQQRGGSTADNRAGDPIWPAVMETAFVKLHGLNPGSNDLRSAFDLIRKQEGGSLGDGMYALTGDAGLAVRIGERPEPRSDGRPLSAPPGSSGDKLPYDVPTRGRYVTEAEAFTQLRTALDASRPVTLSTMNKEVNDGLMENHAYMVTDIQKEKGKEDAHVWVTLRNPYAHNQQEGAPERGDTARPDIRVRLDRLVETEALGEFNIGPAPRMQNQQQDPPQPTMPQQTTPLAPVVPASLPAPAISPADVSPRHQKSRSPGSRAV